MKIGGRKGKAPGVELSEPVVEKLEMMAEVSLVQEAPALLPEPNEMPGVATTPELANVSRTAMDETAPTPEPEPTAPKVTFTKGPGQAGEPTPEKPRKLKVKADTPRRKLSMMASTLQVLLCRTRHS